MRPLGSPDDTDEFFVYSQVYYSDAGAECQDRQQTDRDRRIISGQGGPVREEVPLLLLNPV